MNEVVLETDIITSHATNIITSSPLNDAAADQAVGYRLSKHQPEKIPIQLTEIPDPTPIAPGGVKAVSTLPIHKTLLKSDLNQIVTFYELFSPFLLTIQNPFGSSEDAPSSCKRTTSAHPTKSVTAGKCISMPERQYGQQQTARWNKRFEELVEFRKQHGHSLVPMHSHPNAALSKWVKRQRNQYQRKINGFHSTLSDERQKALEDLDFVWDVHTSGWDGRYEELRQFYREHGHVSVTTSYTKNLPLARWVKCQRRQYRLWKTGRKSFITKERIRLLKELHFNFDPRN